MQQTEHETQPDFFYMKGQPHLNENQRANLIDWLQSIHIKFRLLPETLFITVNTIDRYLSCVWLNKDDLQLLGVTALFIAAKYEEIYPPTLKEFAYITKNACSTKQILAMEQDIIRKLEFQITRTSPYRFLERYKQVAKVS